MVKRQTVWLSTMMVLSLMLIGYYTMNSGSETASTSGGSGTAGVNPVSTPVTPSAPAASKSGTSSAQTNANSPSATTPVVTSVDDWFANTQVQVNKEMGQQMDTLNAVIQSNNASTQQVQQALTELQQLQKVKGELDLATDQVRGDGYQDCVIQPQAGGKMLVTVKSSNLSSTDSVKIMNIVSQQLGISILDVTVAAK